MVFKWDYMPSSPIILEARSQCPAWRARITQLQRHSDDRTIGAQVTQNSSGLLPLE